jgi:lycopene cyclase domain-containing protein
MGVWGFNEDYLSGFYVGTLPIEEVLFFICIPYACVFTYEACNILIKRDYLHHLQKTISVVLTLISLLVGLLNTGKWYTCTTFVGLAIYLLLLEFVWRVSFLSRFYFSWCILLIPFFVVNGVLTGSWIENPVVWYNDAENLGIRIGTIPIEDLFYGMFLIVMSVSLFEWVRGRSISFDKSMTPRSL